MLKLARAHMIAFVVLCLLPWLTIGAGSALAQESRAQPIMVDRAIFAALIAKREGRYADALVLINDYLKKHPNDRFARLERADLLWRLGRFSRAELAFRALAESEADPLIKSKLAERAAIIRATKPYGVSGYLSIMPSSNLNQGSAVDEAELGIFGTVPISEAAQAKAGWALSTGISGYFRKFASNTQKLELQWGYHRYIPQGDKTNSTTSITFALPYTQIMQDGRWVVTPEFEINRWHEAGRRTRKGVSVEITQSLSDKLALGVDASMHWQAHFENDYQYLDGRDSAFALRAIYQLPERQFLTAKLSYARSDLEAKHQSHKGHGIELGYGKSWQSGLQIYGALSHYERVYLGPYTGRADARTDDSYRGSLSVQHNAFSYYGFTPSLSCSVERQRSNIGFYTQNTNRCALSIVSVF